MYKICATPQQKPPPDPHCTSDIGRLREVLSKLKYNVHAISPENYTPRENRRKDN